MVVYKFIAKVLSSAMLKPMATSLISFVLFVAITSSLSYSKAHLFLSAGSSLSVERQKADILTSPNGIFSAGFHLVKQNAYYFAIWFNDPSNDKDPTVVWMANRDQPVNEKRSRLTLLKTGNLILSDAGRTTVWSTSTFSGSFSQLHLEDSGNMVLRASDGLVLWQSFDSPTNTLLPEQPLTRYGKLVSSRSQTNLSSGLYKLFFDNDNVLRLIYDSIQLSSVYWPAPWLLSFESGRTTYNNSKIAVLDSLGNFSSSDDFTFMSADYGKNIQRMFRLDYDGNIRLYGRKNPGEKWVMTWQAFMDPCKIHGLCGANSLCSYSPNSGRKCSCLQGHKMRNLTDWSYGCEPEFTLTCGRNESTFVKISNTEFYGYDSAFFPNSTFKACVDHCLQACDCVGFQYTFYNLKDLINFNCYIKTSLLNGLQTPSFFGDIYLKVPKTNKLFSGKLTEEFKLDCSNNTPINLARTYSKSHTNTSLKLMLWFACGVGIVEIICVLWVCCLLIRPRQGSSEDTREYALATTGFKRFSFIELKKATRGFTEEIGRGAGGIVYKGILSDSRVAAIKRLSEALKGEAEFLAEVNTVGRVNHMNLIEMWGFCAEGKHRLLVYEYLEHGSLKENLSRNVLDWKGRFEIALGTARGLAYLHEECLEWVLHCDVKPQNILLGSDYQPKVADFGLSKLLKRGELSNTSFSRIRGTRGYMAPEWVTNQSITSKVDVYSYGIVLLEILSGRSPSAEETQTRGLVTWVREKVGGNNDMASCVEENMESWIEDEYDKEKMGILLGVALKCVEEDVDARPTMSQVVEMLQAH